MRYIKYFESTEKEKTYWLVPTDDRFEKSLLQINCNKKFIFDMLNNIKNMDDKYLFIGYNYDENFGSNNSNYNRPGVWNWNPYKGKKYDDLYNEQGYKFCGLVNIREGELDANKYNL